MNEGLIPNRYAKALYKYSLEKGDTTKVYTQMKALCDSYAATPGLRHTVENPYLSTADKERVLLTAAGASSASDVARFLRLVIHNSRVNLMQSIAMAYQNIYRTENSIEQVVITTATPLADDELSKLKAIIEKHEAGMRLEYVTVVNPDIIGGFTVRVDSKLLDASIKNELKKLRLKLLS